MCPKMHLLRATAIDHYIAVFNTLMAVACDIVMTGGSLSFILISVCFFLFNYILNEGKGFTIAVWCFDHRRANNPKEKTTRTYISSLPILPHSKIQAGVVSVKFGGQQLFQGQIRLPWDILLRKPHLNNFNIKQQSSDIGETLTMMSLYLAMRLASVTSLKHYWSY
ncbi:hypothetical protein NQ317_007665 [Molorchus minor]|uniref:Uncharacterized protein n=1 Tax=Molorchus minor TaxID=1323400 RepID=A0ABQ9J1J3_9CUCU|nr:hypothetical protein NQ317_007665 [Molorchus minor]